MLDYPLITTAKVHQKQIGFTVPACSWGIITECLPILQTQTCGEPLETKRLGMIFERVLGFGVHTADYCAFSFNQNAQHIIQGVDHRQARLTTPCDRYAVDLWLPAENLKEIAVLTRQANLQKVPLKLTHSGLMV